MPKFLIGVDATAIPGSCVERAMEELLAHPGDCDVIPCRTPKMTEFSRQALCDCASTVIGLLKPEATTFACIAVVSGIVSRYRNNRVCLVRMDMALLVRGGGLRQWVDLNLQHLAAQERGWAGGSFSLESIFALKRLISHHCTIERRTRKLVKSP